MISAVYVMGNGFNQDVDRTCLRRAASNPELRIRRRCCTDRDARSGSCFADVFVDGFWILLSTVDRVRVVAIGSHFLARSRCIRCRVNLRFVVWQRGLQRMENGCLSAIMLDSGIVAALPAAGFFACRR